MAKYLLVLKAQSFDREDPAEITTEKEITSEPSGLTGKIKYWKSRLEYHCRDRGIDDACITVVQVLPL
ncbi:MAG: hypothetical protein WC783_05830 [Candidatus Paceibacterota bacterium]